jgi:tRNA(Ile)-lysidine synthase
VSKRHPFGPDRLARSLRELIPGYPDARLCIAFSGGLDSAALLHAAVELARAEPRLALRAIHVDHGLQEASVDWARLCQSTCARLGTRLDSLRLALELRKGDSIEAEARRARYAALAEAMAPGECLLTAHHADDQLETVLLQLIRGAGARGLSAMPRSVRLGEGMHLRPLLEVEREELVEYARTAGLDWIEDPMNADTRYDRSWLRRHLLPPVRKRWPSVAHTVGRSAKHLAQAEQLVKDLARIDGVALVDDGRLEIAGLLSLPQDRQFNLLRWWITEQGLGVPSSARLGSILRDVVPARDDAQPVVTWRDGEVRRYRGRLYAMRPLRDPASGSWWIEPGGQARIPGCGVLSLVETSGEGLSAGRVAGPFRVGLSGDTAGGRDCRAEDGRLVRKVIERAGLEPWLRRRVPLIYAEQGLLAVGDFWLDEGARAGAGERSAKICWVRPS